MMVSIPGPRHTMVASAEPGPLYSTEWLLTSGNGGFAMGTALGVNRRKYHALLVASARPPVERLALLNSLDIELVVGGSTAAARSTWLAAHNWARGGIERANLAHLVRFEKEPDAVRWVYRAGDIEVIKELRLGWRCNRAAVRITVRPGSVAVRLRVWPMVSIRDFHATTPGLALSRFHVDRAERSMSVTADGRTLELASDRGHTLDEAGIRRGVVYDLETERHQDDHEDLLCPGAFVADAAPGGTDLSLTIAAALAPDRAETDVFDRSERGAHLEAVVGRAAEQRPELRDLAPMIHAADDFLVQRHVDGDALTTVIAGYPWFADWGRDTMISLVGLMLVCGRFEDALGCLRTFAAHVSRGMIPNRFDDYGGEPEYNTVDAPLWFLHASCEYLRVTGDRESFQSLLLPACTDIIEHYTAGTRYNIQTDPADGLVYSGDETSQLTWMDARRNGVVFTPRHGKAVEINALWHHGLCAVASAIEGTDGARAGRLRETAQRVAGSFRRAFLGGPEGGLHDCLRPDGSGRLAPTGELRPNQIFAVSLEHSPLTAAERAAVVDCVRTHLVTPMGLRTLAPGSAAYRPRFEGDMMERDRAYHNGTVWPWLIGPFAEAVMRVGGFSEASRAEACWLIKPLIGTMAGPGGCLGQIAEVYDAEEPRRAQGCTAQAWSVAEVLRVAALIARPQ